MSTYFTLPEAKSKINHHVKALAPFVDINIGDYGMVTSYYKMGRVYGVTVKWDHINITDGFSKGDYERFLEEVWGCDCQAFYESPDICDECRKRMEKD